MLIKVRIEISVAGAEGAVHPGVHTEAWVRVLHDNPHLTLKDMKEALGEGQQQQLADYEAAPCAAYSGLELDDESGEDEMEGYRFEDWYCFPGKGTVKFDGLR